MIFAVYLEYAEIDFWGLGSTTLRKQEKEAGKEPDECSRTNYNRAKDVGLVGLPEGGAGVEGAAVTRAGAQGAQQQVLGLLQQQLLQRIHLS